MSAHHENMDVVVGRLHDSELKGLLLITDSRLSGSAHCYRHCIGMIFLRVGTYQRCECCYGEDNIL